MRLKHCTLCREPFDIGGEHDCGDVLEHWAKEHDDSEVFWNILENYRTHTRCGDCGEMFHSEIRAGRNGLLVRVYCDDCSGDRGLGNQIKSLMVDDVTGRYVLDNQVEVGADV